MFQRRSIRSRDSEVHVVESNLQQKNQESNPWSRPFPGSAVPGAEAALSSVQGAVRELPDVTGFLVVVLVTLGLFIVPVGATIMQGPAIVASLLAH
jgi:hypothetical protein